MVEKVKKRRIDFFKAKQQATKDYGANDVVFCPLYPQTKGCGSLCSGYIWERQENQQKAFTKKIKKHEDTKRFGGYPRKNTNS